jgi:hypothetical protein
LDAGAEKYAVRKEGETYESFIPAGPEDIVSIRLMDIHTNEFSPLLVSQDLLGSEQFIEPVQ